MGFLIYDVTVGTTTTDPSTIYRIIDVIDRTCEIFYTSSKKTLNMKAEEPFFIDYESASGARVSRKARNIDKTLVRTLSASPRWRVTINVSATQVAFEYDRNIHNYNNVRVQIKAQFREFVFRYILGLVLEKDVVGSQWEFDRVSDRAVRIKDLIISIFKKHFGDTFYYNESNITLQDYARDSTYINLFGFKFTIRRKY